MGAVLLGRLLTGLTATVPVLSPDGHAAHEEWCVSGVWRARHARSVDERDGDEPDHWRRDVEARVVDIELEDSMVRRAIGS
jgi:hypothetical protein